MTQAGVNDYIKNFMQQYGAAGWVLAPMVLILLEVGIGVEAIQEIMQNKNTIAEKKAKLEELEKKAEQLKTETEAIKNKTEEYQKSEKEILKEMIQEQNSKWKPSIDSMTATDRMEYSKGGSLEWNQMKGGYTAGELNEQITTPVNPLPNTSVEEEQEIPKTEVGEGTITTPQTPTPEQKPEEEKDQIQIPGGNIVEDKTNENIEQPVAQTWTLEDIIDFYKKQQSEQWAREDQIRAETQEREDTAYQRAVDDMRKAGINPNLMNVTPADSGGGITQATGMDSSAITKQMENTSQELVALLEREFEGDENTQKQIMSLIGELISSAAMIYAFKKK